MLLLQSSTSNTIISILKNSLLILVTSTCSAVKQLMRNYFFQLIFGGRLILKLLFCGLDPIISYIISFLDWYSLARLVLIVDYNFLNILNTSHLEMCLWDNDYLTRTRVEKKSCLNIKHLLTLSISNPRYLLLLKEQLHRLSSRGLEYAKKGSIRKSCDLVSAKVVSYLFPPSGFVASWTNPPPPLLTINPNKNAMKSILFNPRFGLIAISYRDFQSFTFVVCSYEGSSQQKIGKILYHYCCSRQVQAINMSWSPDGTKLAILERQEKERAKIRFFIFHASVIRRINYSADCCHYHLQTVNCWDGENSFWTCSITGKLTKYSFAKNNKLIVEVPKFIRIVPFMLDFTVCNNLGFWFEPCKKEGHQDHSLLCQIDLYNTKSEAPDRLFRLSYGYIQNLISSSESPHKLLILYAACPFASKYSDDLFEDFMFYEEVELCNAIVNPKQPLVCSNSKSPWLGKRTRIGWSLSLAEFTPTTAQFKRKSTKRNLPKNTGEILYGGKKNFNDQGYHIEGQNDLTLVAKSSHYRQYASFDSLLFFKTIDVVHFIPENIIYSLHPHLSLFVLRSNNEPECPIEVLQGKEADPKEHLNKLSSLKYNTDRNFKLIRK